MSVLPLRNKKTLYGVTKSRRKMLGDVCVKLRETINAHRILVVKSKRRDFLENMYWANLRYCNRSKIKKCKVLGCEMD
jgi:hypothetical protein